MADSVGVIFMVVGDEVAENHLFVDAQGLQMLVQVGSAIHHPGLTVDADQKATAPNRAGEAAGAAEDL